MRIQFTSWKQYLEAWKYMMSTGAEFTYHMNELWVELDTSMDLEYEYEYTVARLKEIQAS